MDDHPRAAWGKVPAYVELARASRRLAAGSVERRYWYILCRERTPHGTAFYYIKSRVETWEDGRLAGEDFAVQRLPGQDDEQSARRRFRQLAEAQAPVSPVHLTDILRDLALMAAEQPARWPLPRRQPAAPHRRSPRLAPVSRGVPRPAGRHRPGPAAGPRPDPLNLYGKNGEERGTANGAERKTAAEAGPAAAKAGVSEPASGSRATAAPPPVTGLWRSPATQPPTQTLHQPR